MFTITNDQLKAIKRALDLLDVKLLDNHTPAQLNTLLDAFEAFDTVFDDQEIEGDKLWVHQLKHEKQVFIGKNMF